MVRRTFSIGGVHPSDSKISRECRIEELPLPPAAYISTAQHIGAPAVPVVAPGDKVKVGQVIAEPGGFMSAYIHSSVSGTVKSIGPRMDLAGNFQTYVEIAVEGDEWLETIDRSEDLVIAIPEDPKAIIEKIKLGGVVGLGGATFPTHVKLSPPPGKKCEMLIINGCECEPYLTSDFRTLLEKGEQVIVGTAIIKQALGVDKATIAVEDNKPEAISHIGSLLAQLKQKSDKFAGIEVMPLMKKYPEGGEKQLIDAVMRRQVKSGGLPIDVGAVVQNVATALAVYDAVQKNKPLIDNSVTVTGECFPHQANLLVRVGTPLRFIIDHLGGMPADAAKVISGGPMMGKAVSNLDASTLKGTGALLFLTEEQTRRKPAGNCIRCGKCADACPMGLEPYLLNRLYKAGDTQALEENAVQDCIQCGCCLYSCPAYIPLLDNISMARGQVMGIMKARAAAARAAAEAQKSNK
ncbi:MAG: electron transport complex subunit RsxC [Candidatus Cryptobacteroides sp.]